VIPAAAAKEMITASSMCLSVLACVPALTVVVDVIMGVVDAADVVSRLPDDDVCVKHLTRSFCDGP